MKKILKPLIVLTILVVTIVSASQFLGAESTKDSFYNFGKYISNMNSSKEQDNNNKYLNAKEFKKLVYYYENNIPDSSSIKSNNAEEMAIDNLVKKQAIIQEAKQRGITVSDAEVDEVVEEYIKITNERKPSEAMNLIEGLGLTVEEYFKEYAYEKYRASLYAKKLEKEILSKSEGYSEGVKKFKKLVNDTSEEYKRNNKEKIEKIKQSNS